MTQHDHEPHDVSRRRLVSTVGVAGATGLTVGATGGAVVQATAQSAPTPPTPLTTVGSTSVPFHGTHQAGITTPVQAFGHLVAFDLMGGTGRKQAAALLRRWSATARDLMAGKAPAEQTGIALDAGPASLTITFGFGRTFFSRTGLKKQLPDALAPLPEFSGDALDKSRSNGDLWVQIGANDGLVAFNALRVLQRQAAGTARLRWQMNGFNRTPGTTKHPMTARNLMGQIDGSNNPKPSERDFQGRIFVSGAGSASASDSGSWMAGGSYAVVRRIRMLLDDWDKE
ncbi:MAG TPA: Dyp-type peroxidase, partial [Streptomyces sp.]|nr:Dyp-type peroxidase [Streptomyces sp.]